MKIKHLLLTFALILGGLFTLTPTASADIEFANGKLKLGAHARVRYEFFNNTDFSSTPNDTRDFVLTRVRPSLWILPHEEIEVLFQPQFAAAWGEIFGTSITSVNAATATSTSGSLNDPTLGIHQAYFKYSPSDWFSMTIGRQEIAYGEHLLIGNVGWHNVGRAFDALKLKFSGSNVWVDVMYTLLSDAEGSAGRGACAAPCTFGDHHFGGVYASWDAAEWMKSVDFYAFYRFDSTARPRAHNYLVAGTRLKGNSNNFDYRFEATGQFGKSTITGVNANHMEYQFDAEFGYTFENAYNFRVALEGFMASRDYIQQFPTAHKWIGFIDLFGRRNIMGGVIHLSLKPTDKLKFNLDAHTLFRTSSGASLFALNGTTPVGAGASTSKFAGEEIDFSVTYKPLDILSFKAGANVFLPMGFIKANAGTNPAMFGYLQTSLKF